MCCELSKIFIKDLPLIITKVFTMETQLTKAVNLGEMLSVGQVLVNSRELSF